MCSLPIVVLYPLSLLPTPMLSNNSSSITFPSSESFITCLGNNNTNSNAIKRKRRPPGTPDPDAEVVLLSPKTLMESDRYVCEICDQGFQREQNLQLHRRRHKVPWKLLKRSEAAVRKRVFVCPEPSCLHHNPRHALGDLVGIKKHFRRKHSNHKQWSCDKCYKAYAVQSDYKAHLKTCGTRGHSCDCGRVFSRVESFIEHQAACNNMGLVRAESQTLRPPPPPGCLSRTASSLSPASSDDVNLSGAVPWSVPMPTIPTMPPPGRDHHNPNHNLELQLLPTTSNSSDAVVSVCPKTDIDRLSSSTMQLQLSIGSPDFDEKSKHMVVVEKECAEEERRRARRQMELAEKEFSNAKRIRQQAQTELVMAQVLKDRVNSSILQVTCRSCKKQFPARMTAAAIVPRDESLSSRLALSYLSLATSEGEVEDGHINNPGDYHANIADDLHFN